MQSLFLEPAKEGRLAKCAVSFVLAQVVCSMLSLGLAGAAVLLPVPNKIKVMVALLPIAWWALWLVVGAIRAIRLLKSAADVEASSKEFSSIQYASIFLFLFSSLCFSWSFFNKIGPWTIAVQVFLVLFYIVFFVFGLLARMRISASSWINFGLLLAGLYLSIRGMAAGSVIS